MLAAIGEVQEELHRVQAHLNVIRLSLIGITVDCDPETNLELQAAAGQIESSLGMLDSANDRVTRAYSILDH